MKNVILFFSGRMLLTVALSGFLVTVWAQEAGLTGTVTSATDGKPLSGAHIVVKTTALGTVTDSFGRFTIMGLYPGKYTLKVSYVGYTTLEVGCDITGTGPTDLSLKLEEDVQQAGEVVVTGTRIETERDQVPLSVISISREEIENSGESNLLPVISERVPGVFVTERGVTGFGVATGAAGGISIRGIGGTPNTQVLVLIDGNPQHMGLFGHPLPDAYVASDAEKIEVIRGPASILYGSNAMGGVVNIITRKAAREGFTAHARAIYGSYDTWKAMANAACRTKKGGVLVSVNHDQTNGHRENSGFDITNGYFKADARLSEVFSLNGEVSLAGFRATDPGPVRMIDSSYLMQEHWVDILRGMAAISLQNSSDKTEGTLSVFHHFGEHEIYDGFHSRDRNTGISAYQGLRLFTGNTLTLGAEYKNYGGFAENTLAMNGQGMEFADTLLSEFGIYTFIQQTIREKVSLTAGLRLQTSGLFPPEWMPHGGVSWSPAPHTTVKASVSKGFRSPTIRELYMWNPANASLRPERMWTYEGTFVQGLLRNRFSIEFTGFLAEGSDLILITGQFPDVRYENSGTFRHHGVEASAALRLVEPLELRVSYAWLHMADPVTGAPEHSLYAGGSYKWRKLKAHLNVHYISGLYTVTSPVTREQYTLLNGRIGYQVNRILELFVNGENLLDQAYEINYDYPMPGVMVFCGFNLKYTAKKS
ncbi:MAG: TonB-dependent receptor [Bacteroidales bacterium]|nr:TonB-dependent receptor [Bacteroidales bacterium]